MEVTDFLEVVILCLSLLIVILSDMQKSESLRLKNKSGTMFPNLG